ncbi:HAD hydrolase-like protein [Rhodobacteraceae bacterium 2CG4]|uniref:HAD hydrolase-like protein n=1 Tax=Halovulum marinum TaxID=2662447 RepID=A0A6L5YWK7_9RHOB|nr:HAD hydrolase-like protein [Halovulum marinum]MSU88252.1 HAD hydrolase-like protein [Halovulum marinum]
MLTVFLDLDGTLIDSREGIVTSLLHALREMDAELPAPAELIWTIGPPIWESLGVLLGPGADLDAAVAAYRDRFGTVGLYEADVFDGVGEMLSDLRDMDARLFLATSKPQIYAEEIVAHFGLGPWLDGVFGSELDGTRADKPSLLAHALAATETDPAHAVMVGDRRHDIEGAKANDVFCIGALWGFSDEGELHLAEADALAAEPEEVPDLVVDLLGLAP